MLKWQKLSSDKYGLGFDKYDVSNIASSKTVFVKPKIAKPQNACVDKGKEVVVCKNANLKLAVCFKAFQVKKSSYLSSL
jgi:hypothetical protein